MLLSIAFRNEKEDDRLFFSNSFNNSYKIHSTETSSVPEKTSMQQKGFDQSSTNRRI